MAVGQRRRRQCGLGPCRRPHRRELGACGATPAVGSWRAMTEPKRKIPYGELIAFAALVVSALGVWIAWKATNSNSPTRVVEQRQPIPLTLRAEREDDGTRLRISPVEASHALE